MTNSKRLRWALLLLVPIIIFAIMLPIARERRFFALTQQLIDEARAEGRLEVMEKLIAQGADVNGQFSNRDADLEGNSALHFLVVKPNTDQRRQMSVLLRHGANIDIRNNTGHTPLTLAATFGAASYVQFLIDNGANINAIGDGATALAFAQGNLQYEKERSIGDGREKRLEETVEILKAAGAKE